MKKLAPLLLLFAIQTHAQTLRFLGYFSPTNEVVTPTNWLANAVTFNHITNNAATASQAATYDTSKKLVSTAITGSGSIVAATSPTIVTPTIASMVNANHNHQDAAGGGALSAAAITSGTLAVARGGTGLASGTSGGILGYTASGTLASSAALTANAVMIGGGAGATPATTTTAAGFLTWLGTPSSANFLALITGETGTGAAVFNDTPTIITPAISGAATWTDNVRQTFNPGADAAGVNVGSHAGDPGTPSNGDLWYSTVANALRARINGSTVSLGAGGGGDAPVGTMVNVGNNIVGGIPIAADTTDTNYIPSSVTITGGTNLLAGTVVGTNAVYGGSFVGIGTTADSRVDVPDNDGSAYAGFQANDTTTTSVNMIFPAAPFLGLANYSVSSTTNWTAAQLAGTSGGVIYFSAANTPATSAALAANALVVGGGAGAAPATVTTGAGNLTALAIAANSAGGFVTDNGTATFTGKTIDASAAGNVLRQTKQLILQRPDYGDGTGAVPQTNTFTASGLMHYTLSGNAETNANWIVYEFNCPDDLDTTVAMTAKFAFLSGGTDTDDYVYHITYAQAALGSAYATGTSISTLPIVITVNTVTEANGDIQQSTATTLTGWAAALTPGLPMQVRIARLQNGQDDGARDVQLVITYGSTL